MSVKLSDLRGKQVYSQDARRVGEVVDFGFKVGDVTPSLIVRTPSGREVEIPWSQVAAARDIVLLKPEYKVPEELLTPPAAAPAAAPAAPAPQAERPRFSIFRRVEQKICPYCGKPATWIPQYQRWYCYNCQRYID
jgi:sporulation protein YlmC with PRC-barrel domain